MIIKFHTCMVKHRPLMYKKCETTFEILRSEITLLMDLYSSKYKAILKGNSGIVHADHSCGGKRGKLSGSRLSTIFKFASIQVSDTFTSGGCFCIFWTKK